MTNESTLLQFPADHRNSRWWNDSRVLVRWMIERECSSPLVTGVGTILVMREAAGDESLGEDDYLKVGEIEVMKVPLGDHDPLIEMDAISGDHELLASEVFDGGHYANDFFHWLMDEMEADIVGDPVFVLDLRIDQAFTDPECNVAAHAALDALATFGGPWSPLITFHRGGVDPELRDSLKEEGLWAWVHALRAKQWRQTYVAMSDRR